MLRSFGLAVAAFFVGAAFLITAHFIGILQFQSCWIAGKLVACTTPDALHKEVGFAAALNWSVGLVFLFPLFIYCASETYNHAQHAISDMASRLMFVDNKWQPVGEALVLKVLRRQWLFMMACLVAVLVLGGVFLADDFLDVVLEPYRQPESLLSLELTDPVREVDWSVAGAVCAVLDKAACAMDEFSRSANMYFAGAAYIYLTWIGAALAVGFMLAILAFAASFLSADFRSNRIMIVPDVTSKDTRRGFEVLEGFFTFGIAGCFMLFAMGYLVTLQNVYLRTEHANVLLLIFPFIQPGAELSFDGAISGIANTITGQLGVINPNIVAVTVIGGLFLLIMLAAVAVALRITAIRGKDTMARALSNTNPETRADMLAYLKAKGAQVQNAKDSLEQFVFWPVRWLKVNRLFAWLAAATLSLLVVTVGAYLISIGLWATLRSLYRRIERGFGIGDDTA